MTTTTTIPAPEAPRHPLAEGETLHCQAGRIVVTLQCVRLNAAYAITVYQGTWRIEDNCTALDNEADVRTLARGYTHLFRAEA